MQRLWIGWTSCPIIHPHLIFRNFLYKDLDVESIRSKEYFGRLRAKSYLACKFIQNSGVVPKAREKRQAVSGEIPRLPWMISLIRWSGTPTCLAKATWLIPKGFKNSPKRISPGCVGNAKAIRHELVWQPGCQQKSRTIILVNLSFLDTPGIILSLGQAVRISTFDSRHLDPRRLSTNT